MSDPVEPLILDLLRFVGLDGRPYRDVMEAWRTSCPRLPVWEEALERGWIVRSWRDGEACVLLTETGQQISRRGVGNPEPLATGAAVH